MAQASDDVPQKLASPKRHGIFGESALGAGTYEIEKGEMGEMGGN